MKQFVYLLVLLISLGGLTYIDYKLQLALFWNSRKAALILLINLIFFLVWDIVNISAGIISTNREWVSGVYLLTPNLPIEEFLFLTLLGYQTLLLWRWRCLRTAS